MRWRCLGADVRSQRGTGAPPVIVAAAGLPGGATELAAARSSQFVSALLQVAPYAARDVTLTLTGEIIAQPYIDMTVGGDGAVGRAGGARRLRACSASRAGSAIAPQRYAVEPDASSAHYFSARRR